MKQLIDKAAWIYLKDGKVLITLSEDKDVYYVPGGKIEDEETHRMTLIREIKEELSVLLIPKSIQYYGTFQAQAHDKPEGTLVRMNCYLADYQGELQPDNEIEALEFFRYADKDKVGPVDKLIFDDLKDKGLLE